MLGVDRASLAGSRRERGARARARAFAAAVLLLAGMLATAACTPRGAPRSSRVSYGNGVKVSGVVTYRERIALPDDSVVVARLVDVTKADDIQPLCEQIISKPGQVPVPFVLVMPADAIDQNRNYAIEAMIRIDGKVRWSTPERTAVITRGNALNGVMVWVQRID